MIRRRFVGLFDHVLTATQQLDDAQREIDESLLVSGLFGEQPMLEGLRVGFGRQRDTGIRGQLDDAQPPFRHADDAPQRREAVALEEFGGGAVRRNHEVFDQFRCPTTGDRRDILQLIARKHRPTLSGVQRQGASFMAQSLERLRHRVLQSQVFFESRNRAQGGGRGSGVAEPRADGGIGQLRPVADHGQVQVARLHHAIRRDGEIDYDGRAVCIRPERGEICGEPLRQHRKDACGGVDGRGVDSGVLVDRTAARDQGVNIRNGDQNAGSGAARLGDG